MLALIAYFRFKPIFFQLVHSTLKRQQEKKKQYATTFAAPCIFFFHRTRRPSCSVGRTPTLRCTVGAREYPHTRLTPLTVGNSRIKEGPVLLQEFGSRASAVHGGRLTITICYRSTSHTSSGNFPTREVMFKSLELVFEAKDQHA